MKLDAEVFRYLTKDDLRVLVAIEMGMRNHEFVPGTLAESIAKLKRGGTFKVLSVLLKHKLVHHEAGHYDGYCLTYAGYDILAINTLVQRGLIEGLGNMIGTGKESDIYMCRAVDGSEVVLKLARLGRMSFRAVKNKRDYLKYRSKNNWLYLSRLAAVKEYAYMELLHQHGFPTPTPLSQNRHAILMSLIPGFPLQQVTLIANPEAVYSRLMVLLIRFAEHGLIHGDFNEFNILVNEAEDIYVIDFPQMVSIDHLNAGEFFTRDVETLRNFFRRRTGVEFENAPVLEEITPTMRLDKKMKASGYAVQTLAKDELEDLEDLGGVEEGKEGEEAAEEQEEAAESESQRQEVSETAEESTHPQDYEETKEAGKDEEAQDLSDDSGEDSNPEADSSQVPAVHPQVADPAAIRTRVKKQLAKRAQRPVKVRARSGVKTDL
jgi:RIO kinase 2